jgi:hypothetical protein
MNRIISRRGYSVPFHKGSRIVLDVLIIGLMVSLLLSGCSQLRSLVVREWSDNYALMAGTSATHPQMIDGNLTTAGEASRIVAARRLSERGVTEVLVSLPQTKSISKIVLVSNQLNQSSFEGECYLFVSQQGVNPAKLQQGEWKLVKTFIVEGITTDIHFPLVPTNRILFRLPGRTTFLSMSQRQGQLPNQIITTKTYDVVAPLIQEIEIYGPR